MSEHYDFHYQPTGSGAISGQQVLQQTEDAINELGDYVNDNIGGAMDVAQQALETAQTAETNAQTALDTANSFSSAIQSAQQDASTALSTAQTAQTTASNANNTAIQAQQDASSAVTTANNASGQVSTLSGTVTALGQRVTTAEGNIGQNTSDITALTTRVGTAEGNITTLQNDVTIAQGNASSAMATAGQVKQQAFVFRYSSTALVASSTNSNTLLDNTDNLKVGDKVIDSSGVLFSITAIDTQNSTFTIGTALIDLAKDSDVVHTSGNENVGGQKTLVNLLPLKGEYLGTEASNNGRSLLYFLANRDTQDQSGIYLTKFRQNKAQGSMSGNDVAYLSFDCLENSVRTNNGLRINFLNFVDDIPQQFILWSGISEKLLGAVGVPWSGVYATNYYYGNDNVEFSTKFVTTDTAQTISGVKSFSDDTYIKSLNFTNEVPSPSSSSSSVMPIITTVTYTDQTASQSARLNLRITASGDKSLYPHENNQYALGLTSKKWSEVHGVTYYYGSSDTEFSDKFATVDTAQTISGEKQFTSTLKVNRLIWFNNPSVVKGTVPSTDINPYRIYFGNNLGYEGSLFNIDTQVRANGVQRFTLRCAENVVGGNDTRFIIVYNPNDAKPRYFYFMGDAKPYSNNTYGLGDSSLKWATINGLEPSSLSLPSGNANDVIDISSYLVNLDGTTNSYTVPANGWISIAVVGTAIAIVSSSWSDSRLRESSGDVRMLYPVLKNETLTISIVATTLAYARFIPCQGNV